MKLMYRLRLLLPVALVGLLWGCGGHGMTPSVVPQEPAVSNVQLSPANYIKHVVIIVQ